MELTTFLAAGDLFSAVRLAETLHQVDIRTATDPTSTAWQRDLSISHNKLGDLAVAAGDLAAGLLDRLDDDRALLGQLADQITENPELVGLCKHYDILDKLVLHDDLSGWQLRLHVFLDGYFDRSHNHRWTYTSRILSGSYAHTLYGIDQDFTDEVDVAAPHPCQVRVEESDDTYTLHHSMIHSVVAHGETVTLVVRVPAVKNRFVVTDRITGKAWWQHGAATEPAESAATKRMSIDQIRDRITVLKSSEVFTSKVGM